MKTIAFPAVIFSLLACAIPAHAQQATNQAAATQPGKDRLMVRERVRHVRMHDDVRDIHETTYETIFAYGFASDFAVMLHVPLVARDVDDPTGFTEEGDNLGLGDLTLMAQWRFLRIDHGPIDTTRVGFNFGAELPSGDEGYSSDSVDPFVGLSLTHIRGRHGFGFDTRYKFNTGDRADPFMGGDGDEDAVFYNASHLYRLTPARYQADTYGALYWQTELNGVYEANGDHELLFSPGLLYEARGWAAEVSVQLPVFERVDERPETDFAVVVGLRLLF